MLKERLNDSIAFRVTTRQREALEHFAASEGISLGEAARTAIDDVMKAKGIEC